MDTGSRTVFFTVIPVSIRYAVFITVFVLKACPHFSPERYIFLTFMDVPPIVMYTVYSF